MRMQTVPVEPVRQGAQNKGRAEALQPELWRLRTEVRALGSKVETALQESVVALRRRAPHDSESLITLDHRVSRKRTAVETDCLSLIVAQQPLDGALRAVAATLEIVAELEHIGKYITDIARIHLMVAHVEDALVDLLDDIDLMAAKTQDMLYRALEAYVQQDVALAWAVHADDDAVDSLFRQVFFQVLASMKDKSRALVKQARYLAQIARNLERSADRVTNICEWVIYASTGELMHKAREPEEILEEGKK